MNLLLVHVHSKPLWTYVDSGTTESMMTLARARYLGLGTQITDRRVEKIVLWEREVDVEIGRLDNILLTLENGIKIRASFLVIMSENHVLLLSPYVYIGNEILRHETAHIRGNDRGHFLYCMHLNKQENLQDPTLKLVLDNGASSDVGISDILLRSVLQGQKQLVVQSGSGGVFG